MASPARNVGFSAAAGSSAYQSDNSDSDDSNVDSVQGAASRQFGSLGNTVAPDSISQDVFPLSRFKKALKKFDFPVVEKILTSRGWSKDDLSRAELIINLRKSEKTAYAPLAEQLVDCPSQESLDEIFYPLLCTSIEKKFIAAFSVLTKFTGPQADFYRGQVVDLVTNKLCEEPCEECFEMFWRIVTKFKPDDLQDRVARVLAVVQDPELANQIRQKFPENN